MFKNLSKNQKSTIIVCFVLIIFSVAAGIITRCSYSKISLEITAYDNAKLDFTEDYIEIHDKANIFSCEAKNAISNLDKYNNSIFEIKCISVEYCYYCIKYNAKVINTIKGETDETGKNIILYEFGGGFYTNPDKASLGYSPYSDTLPLKENKNYLVFANKRDYCYEYQQTLDCNEYSIGVMTNSPTVFALDEEQTTFIDINKDKIYSSLNDKYYICFSQEALDHINMFAKDIIDYYT